jgi:hypothetical protein
MNARRAEFSRSVAAFVGKTIPRMGSFPSSPHAVPVPGGAGRHGSAAPVVPDTLSLLTLPPGQSPEACWGPVPGFARVLGGRNARPFRPVPHVRPGPVPASGDRRQSMMMMIGGNIASQSCFAQMSA